MEWTTPEYRHREKGRDWYVAVIIIAAGLLFAEIVIKDVILIILTILATMAFLLMAVRKPKDLTVRIDPDGIAIQEEFHPFPSLRAFAVIRGLHGFRLILESTKRLTPYIIVPLADDTNPEDVRELLAARLKEEDLHEPISHIIFERLGF